MSNLSVDGKFHTREEKLEFVAMAARDVANKRKLSRGEQTRAEARLNTAVDYLDCNIDRIDDKFGWGNTQEELKKLEDWSQSNTEKGLGWVFGLLIVLILLTLFFAGC